MKKEAHSLCVLAREEIAELRAEGYELTDEQIVHINALAWDVVSPELRILLARGRPVKCGSVYLWPLTMKAVDWMDQNKIDLSVASVGMAYAMAHAHNPNGELDAIDEDARKAVKRWVDGLSCTPKQLQEAILLVDDEDWSPKQPHLPIELDGVEISRGEMSAFLTGLVGGPPELWEAQVSISYCYALLQQIIIQKHTDKNPCKADPKIVALRALGLAIEQIKAEGKKNE